MLKTQALPSETLMWAYALYIGWIQRHCLR